jgi:hypothetical protein
VAGTCRSSRRRPAIGRVRCRRLYELVGDVIQRAKERNSSRCRPSAGSTVMLRRPHLGTVRPGASTMTVQFRSDAETRS